MLRKLLNMGVLFWSTVVVAVCLALFTIYQAYDKVKADIKLEKAKKVETEFIKQLATKNEEIFKLQNASNSKLNYANEKLVLVTKKTDEIIKIYYDLVQENIKIQDAQKEAIKTNLGDGFPEINIRNLNGDKYYVNMFNPGIYPMYDVNLSFTNVQEVLQSCQFTYEGDALVVDLDCLSNNTIGFEKNHTIRPGGGVNLNPVIVFKDGYTNLDFKVHARHKSFMYRYVLHINEKVVSFVYKVYDVTANGKIEIDTRGDLKVPDSYWDKSFFPLKFKQGRVIGFNEKF